jgi:oligoribonuclease
VIHHSDEVLNNMNAWCIEHHGKSGLTQKSRDSTVSMAEAEEQLLEFIAAHTPYQSAQLAGNSVHVDRLFLMKYMPRVVEHLHYRIVDVSTVGELCR